MKRLLHYPLLFFIGLFFLLTGGETAVSATPSYRGVTPLFTLERQPPTSCADPEAVVDELVGAQMAEAQLPGVMVAIVQDGAVIVEKGYGRADVEREIPVRADETIFQMGSISKLVTWTAVMQLVEAGKLELHQDVNHYLEADLQIAPTFAPPITLAHLLAHSAGFEERVTGIYTQDPAALGSLADFLAANMPARVRPPGEVSAYSNYGTALAAYVVQRVSRQPFARYAEENIFHPLQMSSASFRQPLLASRRDQMASGYRLAQGELVPEPLTYTRQIGAGGLTATAQDMAHFMAAYLGYGRFEERQILEAETVRQMFDGRFRHYPQLAGNAHGFWEAHISGHELLLHTGDTLSFSSLLALIPEQNAGVFIAYNRTADAPRYRILEGLLTRCWPGGDDDLVARVAPATSPPELTDGKPFQGAYRSVRVAHTTPARLLAFGWESSVRATSQGRLLVDGGQYVSIGPDIFQQVDGPERVAFRRDAQGAVTYLFFDSVPTMAFERLRWWETTAVQITALAVPLLIFLVTLVVWTITALNRRRQRERRKGTPERLVAAAMSLLALLGAGLAATAMMNARSIVFGLPLSLQTAVSLSSGTAVLALLTILLALRVWWRRLWTRWQRLHYTLLAVSGLVYIWFLSYWNLL